MHQTFKWVVKHPKTIIAIFVLLLALCIPLSRGVSVNYNLMAYLPADAPSTQGLEKMRTAYNEEVPSVRIMKSFTHFEDGEELAKQLATVEGVTKVMWLGDHASKSVPLDYLEPQLLEKYVQEGQMLFTLVLEPENQKETLETVKAVVGPDAKLAGTSVTTVYAMNTTDQEVKNIMVIVLIIVFIILLLTTSSWFEPILFLLTIGTAIGLNMGTNILFGEISFVTKAAASLLQLAVSMDYAIFLLHRFADYRSEGLSVADAMVRAMERSFSPIIASASTTIFGFAALLLMRFEIGPDMGWVLGKSVLFSLISVMILLPVLSLRFCNIIDRTHHKPFNPQFKILDFIVKHGKFPVLFLFIIISGIGYMAQGQNEYFYGSSQIYSDPKISINQDRQAIESVFGKENQMVVMVPSGDPEHENQLYESLNTIPSVGEILSFVSLSGNSVPEAFIPTSSKKELVSGGYTRMVLTLNTDYEGEDAFAVEQAIQDVVNSLYPGTGYTIGETPNTADLKEIVTEDNTRVNLVAIGSIAIILLITFRGLGMPLLLLTVIEAAIFINLGFPYFTNKPIFFIGYLIIGAVQLGATVDYAILFGSRYLENREKLLKTEAISQTIRDTGLSIGTSASIMCVCGFLLGAMSSNGVISQLGILIGRGALISALLVLTVLPSLIWLADTWVTRPIKNRAK